jgi:hypothetical protein
LLEVGHSRFDFRFPARSHRDVAALDFQLHWASFGL